MFGCFIYKHKLKSGETIMAVEIHRVTVDLVDVDSSGTRIDKNAPSTKLKDRLVYRTEHRVVPKLTGPSSSANSADYPTIDEYLAAEAGDDFQLAYMDQYQIVTQKIT